MTLLEYTIEHYLGLPTRRLGNGESEWPCPVCGHPRFHTMPHKPQFRDRFRCWSCNFRGDLCDWLKEQHPEENYGDRLARIDQLRREWQAQRERDEPAAYFVRGAGSLRTSEKAYDRDPREDEFSTECDSAVTELGAHDLPIDALKSQEEALRICAKYGLHPLGLAERLAFIAWVEETDREHMEGCEDPNCEWACCRLARGWTRDEIRADVAARQRRMERIRQRERRAG